MTTQQAIRHFGSQAKLAKALGIKPPSVSVWGERPPMLRQFQIERLTGGKLKADKE